MAQLFKTCGDNNQTLCEVNNSTVQVYNSVDDLNAAYALGCINDGDIVAVPDSCYQQTTCIEVYDGINIGSYPVHVNCCADDWTVNTTCDNNIIIGGGKYEICGDFAFCKQTSLTMCNNINIGTSNTTYIDENACRACGTPQNNTVIGSNNTIPSGCNNMVFGNSNTVCGVTYSDCGKAYSVVKCNIVVGNDNCAKNIYHDETDTEDEPSYDTNRQIIIGNKSTADNGIVIGSCSCVSNYGYDTVLIGNDSYAITECGWTFTISKLWRDNNYWCSCDGCSYGHGSMWEIKFARPMAYCQCNCNKNCDVYNAWARALCCIGCNFTNCPGWLTGSVSGNSWVRCGTSPNCVCSMCGIENIYMSSSCICFRLNGGGCAFSYGPNTTANVRHYVGTALVYVEI